MSNIRLPTELWRKIFFHSIYVSGLLETEWNYDPDDQLWRGWQFVKDVSIEAKWAIVLVCQEWRAIGLEFLYETIQIPSYNDPSRFAKLNNLIVTLAASALPHSGKPDSTSGGYGWWTKRIDCPSEMLSPHNLPHLISLLKHVHNLSIFTIKRGKARQSIISKLYHILKYRFSHSLHRLDFEIHDPDTGLQGVDLPSIPLRSLAVSLKHLTSNVMSNPLRDTLSDLNIFFPRTLEYYSEMLYFPNLRHLRLMHIANGDLVALNQFVGKHSGTILSLELRVSTTISEEIASLIKLPHNLRSLTVDIPVLIQLDGPSKFPGIAHLGILPARRPLTGPEYIVKNINVILNGGAFPNLTLLRFFGQETSIPAEPQWANVIASSVEAGLILQDARGKALFCDVPSSSV